MTINSRIQVVREVVARVTRTLADKGVTVTQNGTGAFCETNAKGELIHVNIPQIPDNASDEFIHAIHGFIDHEVGHALFSDFATLNKANRDWSAEHGAQRARGMGALLNLVEDVFVEEGMRKLYRGSGQNLHNVARWVCETEIKPSIQRSVDAGNVQDAAFQLIMPCIRLIGGESAFKVATDAFPELTADLMKMLEPFPSDIRSLRS